MYSSILKILALGSFCLTSASAAPTSPAPPSIADTVNHLDSKNMLHWIASGPGRTTTVPGGLVKYAQAQVASDGATDQTLSVHRAPTAHVGGWTNIGQIADYAAKYACELDGDYGVSATIESSIADACTVLLLQVPAVPIPETAWRIYQSPASPGTDGEQVSTLFRFFTNTAAAPVLTESICYTAFTELTNTFCQGKGDKYEGTRGGEIQIGTGEDYLMIGIDPNEA